MRGAVTLEEHHPLFAERNEHFAHSPLIEQLFTDFEESPVFEWRTWRAMILDPSRSKGFEPVWFHKGGSVPAQRIARGGIDGDEFASGLAET
jgi:hypothetical protein